MTQVQTLIRHLKSGKTISALEAVGVYRIFNLKGRINDLRNDGYDIITEMKTDETGKRYADYRLRGQS